MIAHIACGGHTIQFLGMMRGMMPGSRVCMPCSPHRCEHHHALCIGGEEKGFWSPQTPTLQFPCVNQPQLM